MNPELHVRRLVLPESRRDLRFRHRVEREFGHAALSTVDDYSLHATIARTPSNGEGLAATARHLIDQPEASKREIQANVTGAQPFGYNRIAGVASFGLTIEHPAIEGDRAHFIDIDTGPYQDNYVPHVTLFRANHVDAREIHTIIEWLEALAPARISLSAIAASTVRRRMLQTPLREQPLPKEIQLH